MIVTSIKTHKIILRDSDILKILDKYIEKLEENSIVIIASKIIAISQGRAVQMTENELENYIKQEAQQYIPKKHHKYALYITINNNHLTYSSGIDASNGNGYYVLWPENVQEVTNAARAFLQKKFRLI